MKILLINPEYPDTFWSFKHALKFISKKAAFPPLALLTVAAMLPSHFQLKLIDMNATKLKDKDIKWADLVFISAMVVQSASARNVLKLCKKLGARTVAGGPLFTTQYEDFPCIDHLVLNEAEITLPQFLSDLENGEPRHIYKTSQLADINTTPLPRWDLINMKKYSSMSIQYSRGCPFDCEFCDIVVLNGHIPRTKSRGQVIKELDALHSAGWRGSVFIVDDNFIGNKRKLKSEILPAVTEWSQTKKFPFSFYTQVSLNLADDDELINLMVKANFNMAFIGIESPSEDSLAECGKSQNRSRDMVAAVKKLQHMGIEVQAGFIVGFDSDSQSIFQEMINFIQKSGIVTAMVGMLHAPAGTRLYKRLIKENRITGNFTGNNTDYSINFIPKMNSRILADGYKKIVNTIYSPKQYYDRVRTFLNEYRPRVKSPRRFRIEHLAALLKSIWMLGIKEKGRQYFWKLVTWTVFKKPTLFPLSISMAIYGFHFRTIAGIEPTANQPVI
ncbi:MAG: B12-binding domain-containing radical SAM protein [Dehalococcoidia bacterium]|nr:B12-binding domain-containing radical SAM protein [Dehalococcoidia bacterium]